MDLWTSPRSYLRLASFLASLSLFACSAGCSPNSPLLHGWLAFTCVKSITWSQFPCLVQNGGYSPAGQSRLRCSNARLKKTTLGSAGGWLLSRLCVLAQDGARWISRSTRDQINVPGEHRMLAKVRVRVFVFRCLEVSALNAKWWGVGLGLYVFHFKFLALFQYTQRRQNLKAKPRDTTSCCRC